VPAEMTENEIRQVLLNYVRTHAIGVPLLAKQMKDHGAEVPLRTLHLFLGGEVRVTPTVLETLRDFAVKVKPTPTG
jgi:hypothetical protein